MRLRHHRLVTSIAVIALLVCGRAVADSSDVMPAAKLTSAPAPLADPCQSASVAKQFVPADIFPKGPQPPSPVATELIPASSQSIHVCGFLIQSTGYEFVYGGGVSCSTNQVVVVSLGSTGYVSAPGTIFMVPANNALCLVQTKSTSLVKGFVNYTQP